MINIKNIPFYYVQLKDGFWKDRYNLNSEVSIFSVQKRFEETGRFDALRFNGKILHVYFDSDVAKWMESIAYLLQNDREKYKELEEFCDELILSMEMNQREDGYLNSYFQQIDPKNVFKRRSDHELYCAGHLMEAAIAYFNATKKSIFLKVMEKYADYINRVFVEEKSASFVTSGHEEIELALLKFYKLTKNEKYKKLAEFFINERGIHEEGKAWDYANKKYAQDNAPVRELEKAEGHAVRAVYLYTAMADLAVINNDDKLKDACRKLFSNIMKKIYVTGGIGSARLGETFTIDYDLPNLMAYSESCAAIGLVFFCLRMQQLEIDSSYGDTIEKILYNGFLSSTSLEGKSFFYVNPLEICRNEKNKETSVEDIHKTIMPIWKRQEVFGCSCCPPNINRFVASIGDVIYSKSEDTVFVNQYISSQYKSDDVDISIDTQYPVNGNVLIKVANYKFKKFAFRIPSWAQKYTIKLNGDNIKPIIINGYAEIIIINNFILEIIFDIEPIFYECNPNVRENTGKVCLMSGPVVYCLEEVDNGSNLFSLYANPENKIFVKEYNPQYGMNLYSCEGIRSISDNDYILYKNKFNTIKTMLKFIPYYAFANREESDMIVWINKL